jgi:hypothetical protein
MATKHGRSILLFDFIAKADSFRVYKGKNGGKFDKPKWTPRSLDLADEDLVGSMAMGENDDKEGRPAQPQARVASEVSGDIEGAKGEASDGEDSIKIGRGNQEGEILSELSTPFATHSSPQLPLSTHNRPSLEPFPLIDPPADLPWSDINIKVLVFDHSENGLMDALPGLTTQCQDKAPVHGGNRLPISSDGRYMNGLEQPDTSVSAVCQWDDLRATPNVPQP